MTDKIFRAATERDLPAMRRIVARRPDIAGAVAGWIGQSWVYLLNEEVIAFASRGEGRHRLLALYVADKTRGHGHGSKFLSLIERDFSKDSAFVELFVKRSNPRAKGFYVQNGYTPQKALSGWMMSKYFREPPSLQEGRPI